MHVYLPRPQRPSLYMALAATALIPAKPVFSQNDDDPPAPNPPPPAESTGGDEDEPSSTVELPNEETSTDAGPDEESTTTTEEQPEETSSTEAESSTTEEEESSTTEETTSTTEEPTSTTEQETTTTEDPTSTGGGSPPSDLPTLTRGYGIPTYPAATVPPTKDAPFMQHSTAPDGTVFIAVGAILGAFCLALILWRIIVSLLLHRSVERAARAQQDVNSKSGFPAPPAPFYKYTDQGSTMSLSQARTNRKSRGPVPSANLSQSNLFFSPTAAAHGGGGNRASTYLPSGFYAAGAGSTGHGHSISLTNLRPDSRGHGARDSRITPPDSPSFAARRDLSGSALHLSAQPGQRAPSAYLEDLLADDPSALPPPHMPPSSGPSRNSNRF